MLRAPADDLAAVLEMHRRLSEGASLDVLGPLAVEHVAHLMRGTAALWVEQADGRVEPVAMGHPDPDVDAALRELTRGGIAGPHLFVRSLMRSGELRRMSAAEMAAASQLMEPTYRRWFSAHPISEMVIQPLSWGGRQIGALGVARDAGEPPLDESELTLLGSVAQLLAVALQTRMVAASQEQHLRQVRANEQHLDVLAHTDDLTGLLNRRGFLRAVAALEEPLRDEVGVALLDLDDFKDVNDGFGHAAGDGFLMSFASHLVQALPVDAVVARMGGDEFAVLLRPTTGAPLPDAFREALAACPLTVTVADVEVPVRVSAGVSTQAHGDVASGSDLLREADVAMYRAKRQRLGLAVFTPDTDDAARSRLREASLLRQAIADRELTVHLQRQVPLQEDDGPERYEVLVRWPAADGIRLPGEFLQLAHDIGLLDALTDLVVDLSVEQLAHWARTGRRARLAVNLPATSLVRPGFVDGLAARLSVLGLPAAALVLELTESDLVDDGARPMVAYARSRGLGVSIDDFGTGWSALAYLLDVPASELKIDLLLVQGVHADLQRRLLVDHCVRLAHSLGIEVVAEGVEDERDLAVLRELGVDWVQGFLLHRPCAADQLEAGAG